MRIINICMTSICFLACGVVQAETIHVVPVGTPTTINYVHGPLLLFGAIGGLADAAVNKEASETAGEKVKSATSAATPQVYFAAKFSEKLGACGRETSFLDQIISEQTKYPDWVDTKVLTDESALNGNDSDIYIEAFVDRLVVSTSLFEDKLMGAVAIKVYDAHTKKLIHQYRDYTLVSGKVVLHHYSSGSEQEKTDELVQATKTTLDYLAGTLAKNICSNK